MATVGYWITKYTLGILNFVFLLLGTALIGFGTWLLADSASLIALLKMAVENQVDHLSEPFLIEYLAYFVIAIGSCMFLLSFIGYCGTIRDSRCLLITYGTVLCLVLAAQVIAVILFLIYYNKARDETKSLLEHSVGQYNHSKSNNDTATIMWNKLMSTFECCGVNDYNDFTKSFDWIQNKGNRTIPEACCILENRNDLIPRDRNCTNSPSVENSYFQKGCFNVLADWIMERREYLIGVLGLVMLIEIISIILSFSHVHILTKERGLRL